MHPRAFPTMGRDRKRSPAGEQLADEDTEAPDVGGGREGPSEGRGDVLPALERREAGEAGGDLEEGLRRCVGRWAVLVGGSGGGEGRGDGALPLDVDALLPAREADLPCAALHLRARSQARLGHRLLGRHGIRESSIPTGASSTGVARAQVSFLTRFARDTSRCSMLLSWIWAKADARGAMTLLTAVEESDPTRSRRSSAGCGHCCERGLLVHALQACKAMERLGRYYPHLA